MDLGLDEAFELKRLFLRELGSGYVTAREALVALRANPRDAAALTELRHFFHKVAGTAEAVDLGVLGRLCAVCETVANAVHAGELQAGPQVLRVFGDGLSGCETQLNADEPAAPPARSTPPAPELAIGGEVHGARVLVIDDDAFSARLVDSLLRAAGFQSSFCCDPQKAFEVIQTENPDLIILDVVMPQQDGFDLCRRVRAHPGLQLTPIIFVTRRGDVEQRVRGLQVGGNDYIAKPFEPQELVARVRSHLQRLAELREMAIRDGLTRCYNNKYFKTRIEQEIVRARRYGVELTLGMLDIDHFKRINDAYGHPAGDAVLAHLASILTASVRSTDVVARYGGEEFGFLLVEAAVPEATIITNRLRERIARHRFELPAAGADPQSVACTVSIGIAPYVGGDTVQQLLQRADGALYEAKRQGRNQVRVAAADGSPA